MALSVFRSSFSWNQADPATTTYNVDCGFVPEFFIVWITGEDSTTDAVGQDHMVSGVGFWAADTRRSAVYISANAQGNATIISRSSDVAALSLPDTSSPGGADSDGDLDVVAEASWPATDTIQFIVDTQIAAIYGNLIVQVLAIGGSDITNAKVGTFQEPASSGTQDITDPGFQPTGMMIISAGQTAAPPVDASGGCFSVGMTDGTRSWVLYMGGDNGASTTNTVGYMRSTELVALGTEPSVTIDGLAGLGSGFISTGVQLNWSERFATRYCFYLAWAGGSFRADSVNTRTDTTEFSGPTNGFTATAALFVSAGRTASTTDTPTDHSQISIGCAIGATDRAALAALDEDNAAAGAANTEVTTAIETDAVYINIATDSTVQGLMDVVSVASDPWTLVMDTADPLAAFVGVASWGATGAPETVTMDKWAPYFRALAPPLIQVVPSGTTGIKS